MNIMRKPIKMQIEEKEYDFILDFESAIEFQDLYGKSIFLGIDQKVAQATNLIFFIPTSIVAIIVNIKNQNIDLKTATIISVFGILGAIIGANSVVTHDIPDYCVAVGAPAKVIKVIKK